MVVPGRRRRDRASSPGSSRTWGPVPSSRHPRPGTPWRSPRWPAARGRPRPDRHRRRRSRATAARARWRHCAEARGRDAGLHPEVGLAGSTPDRPIGSPSCAGRPSSSPASAVSPTRPRRRALLQRVDRGRAARARALRRLAQGDHDGRQGHDPRRRLRSASVQPRGRSRPGGPGGADRCSRRSASWASAPASGSPPAWRSAARWATPIARDFAVLGGHVNLAARLMQASGDDWVLCDTDHARCDGGRGDVRAAPGFMSQGHRSADRRLSRALGPAADAEPEPSTVDRTVPIELATVMAALDAPRPGPAAWSSSRASPGSASRGLLEELVRQARSAGVRTLVGQAAEIEAATPYHAWRSVFEGVLGLEAVHGSRSPARASSWRPSAPDESASAGSAARSDPVARPRGQRDHCASSAATSGPTTRATC